MAYNPGATFDPNIISRGWENIAQNISGAITKISQQRRAEAQEAATLEKLAGIYDPGNKDQYRTMSLKDKRASLEAFVLKNARDKEAAAERRAALEEQFTGRKLAALNRETAALDRFQGRMQTGVQQPGAVLDVPPGFGLGAFAGPVTVPGMRRGLNPQERFEAALESGVPLDRLDDLTRAEANLAAAGGRGGREAPDAPPQEINIGGVPYVWKPGSQSYGPRADYTVSRRHENALDLAEFKKSLEGAPAGAYIGEQNGALVVFKADGSLWKPIGQANIFNLGGGGGGAPTVATGSGNRPREFKSEAEALKSGVKGEVIINGKRARID